ncbi:hypothetical protein KNJ79_06395 [Sphingopyxis indica]|uniref:hypothetical protein n=1 Tax=Sphingopyxis indica TaxID=436663 RepID=UPI0029391C7A|nr:hypothetical protein [Sphingopyxis indica]WOF44548.1 hypothetical protein KNJ79_06395 [Sphingopyxis indica]
MAGISATMVGADLALHHWFPPQFATLDAGHLAIDVWGAIATTVLALVAYRFWPLLAAAVHILPLLAHTSRILDLQLDPAAYLTMQVTPSWLVPPILVIGTWRHRRRLEHSGRDRSWFISWRKPLSQSA